MAALRSSRSSGGVDGAGTSFFIRWVGGGPGGGLGSILVDELAGSLEDDGLGSDLRFFRRLSIPGPIFITNVPASLSPPPSSQFPYH